MLIPRSHIILFVLGMVLMHTGAGIAQEVWDLEFDGNGSPGDQGWIIGGSYNATNYYENCKLPDDTAGTTPGWLTAASLGGNLIGMNPLGLTNSPEAVVSVRQG